MLEWIGKGPQTAALVAAGVSAVLTFYLNWLHRRTLERRDAYLRSVKATTRFVVSDKRGQGTTPEEADSYAALLDVVAHEPSPLFRHQWEAFVKFLTTKGNTSWVEDWCKTVVYHIRKRSGFFSFGFRILARVRWILSKERRVWTRLPPELSSVRLFGPKSVVISPFQYFVLEKGEPAALRWVTKQKRAFDYLKNKGRVDIVKDDDKHQFERKSDGVLSCHML